MKRTADEAAKGDQNAYYDARYSRGYMQDFSDFYEACRVRTIVASLRKVRPPARILDYGCGEGRYLELLGSLYPNAELVGSDVSTVGTELAAERLTQAMFHVMQDETVPEPDATFDLIVSIEVLEHVADVRKAVSELARLLAPDGLLLLTTPCANPGSVEWMYNAVHRGFQPTADGFIRFASEEPGHLRRLKSGELRHLLVSVGLDVESIRFRGQFFTPLAKWVVRRPLSFGARVQIAMLDWRLLRRVPSGATMVVAARKHR